MSAHTVHRCACVMSYDSHLIRSGLRKPEVDMDNVSKDGGWRSHDGEIQYATFYVLS